MRRRGRRARACGLEPRRERAAARSAGRAHQDGTVENGGRSSRLVSRTTGPGIEQATASRVFERFWRASPDRPGSGLGLSIVRATAERHGGRATAEGARFTIELPAVRKPSENAGTCPARTSRKERREDPAHAVDDPPDRDCSLSRIVRRRRRGRRRGRERRRRLDAAAKPLGEGDPRRSRGESTRQASRRGSPSRTSSFPPARSSERPALR